MFVTAGFFGATEFVSAATINSIDFQVGENGVSEVIITSDEPVTYTSQENSADKQFVLLVPNANLGPSASRELDTSSFNSPVSLVTPYADNEVPGQSKIVVQLKDGVTPNVAQNGNRLSIQFGGAPVPAAQASASGESEFNDDQFTDSTEPESVETPLSENTMSAQSDFQSTPQATPPPVSTGVSVQTFSQSNSSGRFVGSPISLKVRDADVRDVLRLIGESSGFNMVIGDGVEGKVTLSLENVPWDQALSVVLDTMKLGAERNESILRVMTLEDLTREKVAKVRARAAAQQVAPRVTRVFPISYSDLEELKTIIEKFGNAQFSKTDGLQAGAATGQALLQAGYGTGSSNDIKTNSAQVEIDKRTNSIIVQDITENLERIAKLIQILDVQTPQVLVEAKIVEASEEFRNRLSGSLGFQVQKGQADGVMGFNGSDLSLDSSSLLGSVTSPSVNGVAANTNVDLGFFISGVKRLNAFLQMTESETLSKVVSSPKTVVLNKQEAEILSTSPTIQTRTVIESGVPIQTPVVTEANTSLKVQPTVTNDDGVLMSLTIQRDVPVQFSDQAAVGRRTMKTRVLVESGNTLVIGGLYDMQKNISEGGVPFLRDIPLLGAFFGGKQKSDRRSELFIFITPKVLGVSKLGVAG